MKKLNYYNFFFHYIQKMSETTDYRKHREVILNRAKYYYENNKELLEKEQKINIENHLKKKKI